MRAALYLRVSTSDQRLDLQRDELQALATARGWRATFYEDHGVSGARRRRPGLDRLLRDVREGRVDVVAVWRLDRLGRSTRHVLEVLETFRAHDVAVVSATEQLDTSSPLGRMVVTLLASLAELERETTRERVAAGVAAARRRGVRLGRPKASVDLAAARELLDGGRTQAEVAELLGVSLSTLQRRLRARSEA